jgi:hypothetical protein
MMRLLSAILLTLAVFGGCANGNNQPDNDWSKFYQLKNEVKKAIETVSITNADSPYNTDESVKPLMVQFAAHFEDLKRRYPVDFNIIGSRPTEKQQGRPKLVVTVVAKYKDQLGEITWGFNIFFFDERVEFYSSVDDGKEKSFEDLYNYLTIYKA